MLRIQQGQVGDSIELKLDDQAGAPVPIGDASELVILALPPSGPVKTWPASVVVDPELPGATIIGHTTVAGDLAEFGRWLLQPRAVKPAGTFRGTTVALEVLEALDGAPLPPTDPQPVETHSGAPWETHSGAPLETH